MSHCWCCRRRRKECAVVVRETTMVCFYQDNAGRCLPTREPMTRFSLMVMQRCHSLGLLMTSCLFAIHGCVACLSSIDGCS